MIQHQGISTMTMCGILQMALAGLKPLVTRPGAVVTITVLSFTMARYGLWEETTVTTVTRMMFGIRQME